MTADLSGQVIIVTGANSGIGKVTAVALAKMNAIVVMVCRSQERGSRALAEAKAQSGNHNVHLMLCDLSSQASIRSFVAAFNNKFDRLDVLINNAGAVYSERYESVDGLELTFALNHMGAFLLTNLLLDTLKASAPSRIINISSDAHRFGQLTLDDLQRTRRYSTFPVYAQSKLMNIMFTYALVRRLDGAGVTVNVAHPGIVRTNMGHTMRSWLTKLAMRIVLAFGVSEEEGAETVIYLASSPQVAGISGKYWGKKTAVSSSRASYNQDAQEKLWQISETAVVEPNG